MGISTSVAAVLLFSLVPWILAMRALSGVRRLRTTLDNDRTVTHNAVQNLRSGVDQSRLDAQALGKRIAAVATKADEAHVAVATLRGDLSQAIESRCKALAREIATLAEQVASLTDDEGETVVMEHPVPLTVPKPLSAATRANFDPAADLPPPTRRDRQSGEVTHEQGPPSSRTLAGVGPEAERVRKALRATELGISHDEHHGSSDRSAIHRATHSPPR